MVGAKGRMGRAVVQLLRKEGHTVHEREDTPGETEKHDILIACTPFEEVWYLACRAGEAGWHFVDLTEDVQTREDVRLVAAKHPNLTFISGAGLAPGYVNTIAGRLARVNPHARSVEMFCGALPRKVPHNAFSYHTTWSTNGLVNEYVKDVEVRVDGFVQQMVPLYPIGRYPDGRLEYAPTSGGAGTTPHTLDVPNVAYYSLRYPGHFGEMLRLSEEYELKDNPQLFEEVIDHVCGPLPLDQPDIVHIGVRIVDRDGQETWWLEDVHPNPFMGLTAIQIATAKGVVDAVNCILSGRRGFIRPEEF